jgi:Protein of unknown function (DUF4232)
MRSHVVTTRPVVLTVAALVGCVLLVSTASRTSAQLAATSTHSPHLLSCRSSDLTATVVLAPVGKSPSSLAGAVVFANSSGRACALHGVPKVTVVNPGGQAIDVSQVPDFVRRSPEVIVPASPSSARLPDAGTSITWSDWTCAKNSFALVVKFAGWNGSLTAPWGVTTGYVGAPCAGGQASLYVGPVARIAAPS